MKPTILTDWETIRIFPVIDGVDYAVEAEVHITTKQEPADYSIGPEETTEAELAGWWMLPEVLPTHPHHKQLETLLLNEIEERYSE